MVAPYCIGIKVRLLYVKNAFCSLLASILSRQGQNIDRLLSKHKIRQGSERDLSAFLILHVFEPPVPAGQGVM
jgi:hypothetical protein